MPPPTKDAIHPRYRLHDTTTGEWHDLSYGSQLLANVVNTPHRIAADAMPSGLRSDAAINERFRIYDEQAGVFYRLDQPLPTLAQDGALPGGTTGAANIDETNSNYLRGGIGNMDRNYRNRRAGYDQNGEENGGEMPPRGACRPAALWNVANGASDEVTPSTLIDFVNAALHRFEGPDQQEFLNGLAEVLDFHMGGSPASAAEIDERLNGDRNGNAGSFSRTDELAQSPGGLGGNGARDRRLRRTAQDNAVVGTWHERWGALTGHITVLG